MADNMMEDEFIYEFDEDEFQKAQSEQLKTVEEQISIQWESTFTTVRDDRVKLANEIYPGNATKLNTNPAKLSFVPEKDKFGVEDVSLILPFFKKQTEVIVRSINDLNRTLAHDGLFEFYQDGRDYVCVSAPYTSVAAMIGDYRDVAYTMLYKRTGMQVAARRIDGNDKPSSVCSRSSHMAIDHYRKYMDFKKLSYLGSMTRISSTMPTKLIDGFLKRYEQLLPGSFAAYDVKELSEITNNADRWTDFFYMGSYTREGPTGVARALAALNFTSYSGQVGDVARWKGEPCIFRCPGISHTPIAHTYYPMDSPYVLDGGLYHCPTLADVAMNTNNGYAISFPITAFNPDDKVLSRWCNAFKTASCLLVLAKLPILVMVPDANGLPSIDVVTLLNKEFHTVLAVIFNRIRSLFGVEPNGLFYELTHNGAIVKWAPAKIELPFFNYMVTSEASANAVKRIKTSFNLSIKFSNTVDAPITYQAKRDRVCPPFLGASGGLFKARHKYDATGKDLGPVIVEDVQPGQAVTKKSKIKVTDAQGNPFNFASQGADIPKGAPSSSDQAPPQKRSKPNA